MTERIDDRIASLAEMIVRKKRCTIEEALKEIKLQYPDLIAQYKAELLSVLP